MAVVLPVVSSTFASHTKPMLVTIYEASGYITQLPRTMHRHDDILEIILVHQGQGLYSVDGKQYTIEKGDVLIIDSGTVHDESALSQSDLSIGSCGVTELDIPGLAKNHLLKPHQSPLLKTGDMFPTLSQMMKSMYAYTAGSSVYLNFLKNNIIRDIDHDSAIDCNNKKGPERPALFCYCSMELQCKEKDYVL